MFVKRAKFRVHCVRLDGGFCLCIAESILYQMMALLAVNDYMENICYTLPLQTFR